MEGLPPLFDQAVKTVAADLLAFEPAVGREPRHRRAHHAAVDVDPLEKLQQRSKPDRTPARHDGIAEHRDDDGAGARGFALELIDDAGKRMRHAQRIARFADLRKRRRSGHLAPLAGRGRSRSEAKASGEGDYPRVRVCGESPSPEIRYCEFRPLPASGARWKNALPIRIGIDQAAPAAAVERRPLAFGLRETVGHRIDYGGMMAHAAMAAFDLDIL